MIDNRRHVPWCDVPVMCDVTYTRVPGEYQGLTQKIFVNTEKYFDQEDDLAAVTVELGR